METIGMARFTRVLERTVETYITGKELADLFWSMNENQQALFFNELGAKHRLAVQLQAVQDCELLNGAGRYAMGMIGDYK